MRPPIHPVALPSDIGDFADEVRRVFSELGRYAEPLSGQCAPPIDVHETEHTLEVTVDLPGVDPQAVRIVARGNALLIAGEKTARRGRGDSSFHLVERGYGRFARTVRLTVPCLTTAARAEFAQGELHITLPKVAERREHGITVPIHTPNN